MAKVLEQGIIPMTEEDEQYLPNLQELQLGTKYAKKYGALPAFLFSQLALIAQKTGAKIDQDGNGWAFLVVDEKRISLTATIINGNEICSYEKGSNPDYEQIKNDGADAVGSVGYGINGIYDKTDENLWPIQIKSAVWTTNKSWEKAEGQKYNDIIMYNLMLELVESPQCSVPIEKFEKQITTAKLDAVIYDLKNN